MLRFLLVISFILFCNVLISQNLVSNPSFEEFEECPDEVTFNTRKELIPFWYMPNSGTTDYFNSCTIRQVNVPNNVMGSMFALDGEAYTGIILIESPNSGDKKLINYREYLQTELKEPLAKDSLYCVKFYFSIASYSHYAVNRIGLHLSEEKVRKKLSTKVIELEPQIILDTNIFIIERDYWHQVCDTYRAKGDERYITIGNFYDDCETEYAPLDYSIYRNSIQQIIEANKIAYYYIDVVSVTKISDSAFNCCKDEFIKE